MKLSSRRYNFIFNALIMCSIAAFPSSSIYASTITWSGATNTTFSTPTNWSGNVAPANSDATDIAQFSGTPTTNQPNLTASRSVNGLIFGTATGGWTLSSGSGAIVLTIGTGGIDASAQTSGTTTISAPIAATHNQTWKVGTGGTLQITGATTGTTTPQPLTIGASGALGTIILGASTRTGQINFYGGTLELSDDTALGSGTFILPSSSTNNSSAAAILESSSSATRTISNALTVANQYLTIGGTGNFVFTGTVTSGASTAAITVNNTTTEFDALAGTSAFGFTFAGTGTTVLNGAATYTATTTVQGGATLQIGKGGTLGSVAGNISTGSAAAGILAFDRSDSYSYSGNISGIGQVQQIGTGTTILGGTNTNTGKTTVTAGTLQFGQRVALYNATSSSWTATNIVVNSGATLALNVGGTGEFTTTDVGTLVALGSGTGGFKSGSFIGFDTTNASGSNFTYSSAIANPSSGSNVLGVTKLGTNTLTLSGSNTFSGGVSVNNGTLSIATLASVGSTQPLGKNGTVTLAGTASSASGVLQYTGGTGTLSQAVTVTSGDWGTISNTGSGTLTLGGTLTKAGSVLTLSGGTFDVTGQITGGSVGTFNSDLVINSASTVTLDNVSDNYVGPTYVYGGSTLKDGTGTAPSNTVLTLGDTTDGAVTNTFDLNGKNQTLAALDSTSNGGNTNTNKVTNGALGTGTSTLSLSGNNGTGSVSSIFGGVIQDGTTAKTALAVTGGTHTFSGANTYTGVTSVSGGGSLILANAAGNTLASTGAVTLGESTSNTSGVMQLGNGTTASNQTVTSLTTLGTGSANAVVGGNATTSTLTINNSSSDSFGGTLGGATGSQNNLALTKSGAGTLTLSGSNTYTGTTTVSTGTLAVTGSTASGSAVTLSGGTLNVTGTVGGTVNVASGATLSGNGGTVGAITMTGGSIVNLQDGNIGTLHGSSLTLNAGTGNGILSIDVGPGSTTDILSLGTGSASLSNNFTINVNALSGASTGTAYTFISASGGLTLGDFTAGSLTGTLGTTDTFTFTGGGSSVTLTINAPSATYYYTGVGGTNFSTPGNYNTALSGGSAETGALTSTTDVVIAANSPANLAPVVSTATSIHSLTFNTNAGGASVSGTGTLTVAAGGITDSVGGTSTESISAPIALGAAQSWTVTNAGNTLAVSGTVSGTGPLTVAGSGTTRITGSNSYSGGTTVNSGATLLIGNGTSGSATGTGGSLTVSSGGTIGGYSSSVVTSPTVVGTSNSTSFAISGKVIVGTGTDTASELKITGSSASTITNANLVFNLKTTGNQANLLDLGSTAVTFSGTTLTLNIVGANVIGAHSDYTLITDSAGFNSSGLTLGGSVNGGGHIILGGLSIATTAFFGAETNGYTTGFYNGSYLYLDASGDNIEVEVVPEPSTWTLMIGGLAMLGFVIRRKRQKNKVD